MKIEELRSDPEMVLMYLETAKRILSEYNYETFKLIIKGWDKERIIACRGILPRTYNCLVDSMFEAVEDELETTSHSRLREEFL